MWKQTGRLPVLKVVLPLQNSKRNKQHLCRNAVMSLHHASHFASALHLVQRTGKKGWALHVWEDWLSCKNSWSWKCYSKPVDRKTQVVNMGPLNCRSSRLLGCGRTFARTPFVSKSRRLNLEAGATADWAKTPHLWKICSCDRCT